MRRLIAMTVFSAVACFGQETAETLAPAYAALVRRCAEHEVVALTDSPPLRFKERIEWSWGTEIRDVIENERGRADRIISYHDQPLAPDQERKQIRRLQKLLSDHEARAYEISEYRDEQKRRIKMLRALPDAFLFSTPATEPSGELRFDFRPNPEFSPHDRETQAYRGMRGMLWVDARRQRITRMQGQLYKDVNFGWGIFGHLHKGGRFEIQQTEVLPNRLRMTRIDLDFKGRVFLFSRLRILRKETSYDYKSVGPRVGYEEAIRTLLADYGELARSE